MMNRAFSFPSVLALLALVVTAAGADAPSTPGKPEFYRPAVGEYEHLWLAFDGAEAANAFVGLRAGKSTTVWFVGGTVPGGVKKTGAYRVLIDTHDLAVADDSLKGKIILRQVSIWGPMQLLAQVTMTIDAKRSKDSFAGTWTSEIAGAKKSSGSLSGLLTDEKSIRASQSFAPGEDWPSYHGPHGANRVDSSATLIDDLSKARPVWRAEQPTLSGWGTGVDGRYSWRAAVGTVCGGSGSPVYADGRVYLFHYVPAGEPDAKTLEKVLADFEKQFKRKPLPTEREALVDFCRPYSDTIVTCIDAQTGAILWRVTFPRLSGNFQTHKWRGINPTACAIGPVLIANDLGNNWVALNAKTGDVLWTLTGKQKVEGNRAALGAVRAGSLAILPAAGEGVVRAVDPKTGKVVWQQPGGSQALVWGEAGAERVVLLGSGAPACHDAVTGKLLWKLDEKLIGTSGSAALIEDDILVGHILPDPKTRGGHFQGWKLSDAGAKKLWQDDFLPFDENLTVTLAKDRAYVVGENEIRCLDLNSGKLLGKQIFDAKKSPIGSNQWLGLIGNRLLLAPEGQHGSLTLQLLDAAPSLKLVSDRWSPPNNSTTAYAVHSMAFPVVDGRLFVRGMDGIYCYDLRKTK